MKDQILFKKAFLFDLDGTLYLGDSVLPGATKLIQRLRDEDKKILFLTNNSSRSTNDYYRKLKRMGFRPKKEEILTSTMILIDELHRLKMNRIFLLGTPAMKKMLAESKIRHTDKKPQMVIVGFDKTLTYQKLFQASCFIAAGVPYGVTHPDYFCPTDKGPEPDCGSIAKLLELTTNRSPRFVLGKPHPKVIRHALKVIEAKPKDTVLFGDRLSTDIQMANDAKIDSVFVLTGDHSQRDLSRFRVKPTWTLSGVDALV